MAGQHIVEQMAQFGRGVAAPALGQQMLDGGLLLRQRLVLAPRQVSAITT